MASGDTNLGLNTGIKLKTQTIPAEAEPIDPRSVKADWIASAARRRSDARSLSDDSVFRSWAFSER